jgi:arylsulfatase
LAPVGAAPARAQLLTQARTKRPNIVLIVADGVGYSDLGCFGGEILTPNIDRLAKEGLRMTHFYSCGRDCPTRASLLTGLWPHQTGVGDMMNDFDKPGYRGNLNKDCATIAEFLRKGGYQTFAVGKWYLSRHTGPGGPKFNWPMQRGFDKQYGTLQGAGSYFDPVTLCRNNQFIGLPEKGEFYYTDAISQAAASFVETAGKSRESFFLYVAYTAPHWPLHVPSHMLDRYRGKYSGGWDQVRSERLGRQKASGIVPPSWELSPRDARVRPFGQNFYKAWQPKRMEVYAAQVDLMDRGVGLILEKIKQVGEEQNTLVMFLSVSGALEDEIGIDWKSEVIPTRTRAGHSVAVGNNPNVIPGPENSYQSYGIAWANVSNTPFRLYARYAHEGGIATPLVAYWPGTIKQAGGLDHQVAHVVDIMPTCLELAKIQYPTHFEGQALKPLVGKSLTPILRGEKREAYPLFWEHEGNCAVREAKWKLVRQFGGEWELYDVVADRTETKNVAAQYPVVVQDLTLTYQTWAKASNVEEWHK